MGAVAVATAWYVLNDVVDYLVTPFDTYTHTLLNAEPFLSMASRFDHSVPAHDIAAAAAVTLTVSCVFLAMAARVAKVKAARTNG
jgi:uncharacterized membrane protein YpjA